MAGPGEGGRKGSCRQVKHGRGSAIQFGVWQRSERVEVQPRRAQEGHVRGGHRPRNDESGGGGEPYKGITYFVGGGSGVKGVIRVVHGLIIEGRWKGSGREPRRSVNTDTDWDQAPRRELGGVLDAILKRI